MIPTAVRSGGSGVGGGEELNSFQVQAAPEGSKPGQQEQCGRRGKKEPQKVPIDLGERALVWGRLRAVCLCQSHRTSACPLSLRPVCTAQPGGHGPTVSKALASAEPGTVPFRQSGALASWAGFAPGE